jgi:hypothetical protein
MYFFACSGFHVCSSVDIIEKDGGGETKYRGRSLCIHPRLMTAIEDSMRRDQG